jgi:hypothetical protein
MTGLGNVGRRGAGWFDVADEAAGRPKIDGLFAKEGTGVAVLLLLAVVGNLALDVNNPATLGTWAIRFLSEEEEVDGEVNEEEALAAEAAWSFLNRSIIVIDGLSLDGGLGKLAVLEAGMGVDSVDATWAIRCFFTGMITSEGDGAISSDLRFLSSLAPLTWDVGWYS